LDALPAANVWTDDDPLGSPVRVEEEELERIAEVIVVELVIANPMKSHGGLGCHKEVKRRTQWTAI